jgi:hypothetical protein
MALLLRLFFLPSNSRLFRYFLTTQIGFLLKDEFIASLIKHEIWLVDVLYCYCLWLEQI